MTSNKLVAAAALTAILSMPAAATLHAADGSRTLTMKPLQGLSFDVGAKRAVSYFQSSNGRCKLVLTLADAPEWDEVQTFTATRFEADLPAGKTTRYQASVGQSIEFACHGDAQAMTVIGIEKIAAGPAQ